MPRRSPASSVAIPVMGHDGLTPQAVNALGGYRSRGARRGGTRQECASDRGRRSRRVFAGHRGDRRKRRDKLTGAVAIPTIGIGGSAACDGQILVTDDMLGLFAEFTPKFVKRYRRLGEEIGGAAREYADEVRSGRFPAEEHTYRAPRRARSATAE